MATCSDRCCAGAMALTWNEMEEDNGEMDNYVDIFNKLWEHSENEVVEFKKAETGFDIDELGKYFSALSNEANLRERECGWIVFGVWDKKHKIIGTSFKDSESALNKLKQDMSQHTSDELIFRDIVPIEVGMEASAIDGVLLNHERISSTKIREYLFHGQLDLAKEALGRYYSMSGIVVHGNQIGRNLGFPTANVNINRRISPLRGVYAVKVLSKVSLYDGMANVGYRPTVVAGQNKALLEVNLFNFKQDLYGESIRVFFISKIRDEVKFSNIEVLQEQLLADKKKAKEILAKHSNYEF
mgnify:CR=1 FL=1